MKMLNPVFLKTMTEDEVNLICNNTPTKLEKVFYVPKLEKPYIVEYTTDKKEIEYRLHDLLTRYDELGWLAIDEYNRLVRVHYCNFCNQNYYERDYIFHYESEVVAK